MKSSKATTTNKNITNLPEIAEPLLIWYRNQARVLPWREHPLPYHVWISEIMLQQTRVETVKPYFERFISALPDIQTLAEAPPDTLMKLWEGLGYYTRARNLQKAAQEILERYDGRLPSSFDELLTLPGIGRYTAGAIASIAYGFPVPAVDGNVLRVIARVIASREEIDKEKIKRSIENLLLASMPKETPGDFNQALMELGAMICLPKGTAKCASCPLKQICLSKATDCVSEIPRKAPKKARRIEEKTIFIFLYKNKVGLVKRPPRGLLAGMWELPNAAGILPPESAHDFAVKFGLVPRSCQPLSKAKHIFTHIEWHMVGYAIPLALEPPAAGSLHWITADMLAENFAVPTAFRVYINEIWKLLKSKN